MTQERRYFTSPHGAGACKQKTYRCYRWSMIMDPVHHWAVMFNRWVSDMTLFVLVQQLQWRNAAGKAIVCLELQWVFRLGRKLRSPLTFHALTCQLPN